MMRKKLGFTEHAMDRMNERDISRATVEAVVESGEVYVELSGVKRYTLLGLVVVVDEMNVVTVYFDSNQRQKSTWSKKKKQRAGQVKDKPTWIQGKGHINISQQERYLRQMEGRR